MGIERHPLPILNEVMKRFFLSGLVSLVLAPFAGMAANYFNPNGGLVTSPIDIHAANFTNFGEA